MSAIHRRNMFLQWDPRDYDGATEIFLSSSDVWIPEFSLYYSHHFNQAVKLWSNNDVRVNYTGHTRYYIPFSTESLCKLDVKFFPFDIQQCTLLFGSWAHSNDSISYSLYTPKLSLIDFYDNQEWELDMAHSSIRSDGFLYDYLDPPLFWEMIIMELVVVRMSFYYVFNLVIPSTIIALVAIIGFHTPGTSGKTRDAKFRLGIMTLMSMSVILLAIVEDMPKFSMSSSRQGRGSFSGIPLIGLYYFILLAIIGLSTVTTSMFVYLERHFRITGQIPCWLEWVACDSSCTRGGLFSWRNKTRTPRRVKADEQQEHLLLVNGHVAGAMGSSSSNNNNNNNNNSSEKTRSIAMSLLRVVPTTTTTGNGQRGSSPHCLRSTADVPLNSTTSLAGETNLNFEASPRRGRLRREISEYDNLVLYRFLDASVDELSDRLAHLGEVLRQVRLDITSLVPSTHADVEKRWQTIIRRLELASLFGYISMVSLTLFLFFHHDWYCSIGHNPCAQPNLKCSWMVATEAENAATCQQNSYN